MGPSASIDTGIRGLRTGYSRGGERSWSRGKTKSRRKELEQEQE